MSRVCLGGMQFGQPQANFHAWTIGADETREVVRRAVELGVNFFDNANAYSAGTSEQFVGDALRALGVRREDVVLASKVYFNPGGLSHEAIEREVEGSLRRLGTDYLDVYLVHRFDYDVPVEETMEALDGLVRSGKVRAIGASEMYAYQLHNMQVCAERNGWATFSVLQPHHNLIYREGERELIPLARQYGMAVTPFSALAAGHLARPTWEGSSRRAETDKVARDKYDASRDNDMLVIARVDELAREHGVPMADIALSWLWATGIEAPVVGCNRPGRVDDAVRALDTRLTDDEVAYLEEPYRAHELVGPAGRPGEKQPAGIMKGLR